MKKILLASVLLLTACGTDLSIPENVAEKYLNAYYRYEYLEAAKYTLPGNRAQLEQAAEGMKLQGHTPRQLRRENEPVAIRVYRDGMIVGKEAYVSYTVSVSDEDTAGGREVLVLHLQDGKWRVVY
jgi:outer membrane lipopolysaccharide assembly protein LptE/RlpB